MGGRRGGAWGIRGGGGVECRWRSRGRGAAMEALHEPGPRLLYLRNFEDIFSRGKGPVPRLSSSFLPEQQVRVIYRIRV